MILYLQRFIYAELNKPDISDFVTGIYYQVPVNTKFPYIYFGNFVSKDISAKDQRLQNISFKIVIYQRDQSLKSMLGITDKIIKKLSFTGDEYIVSTHCLEQKINLQNDGITHEIILMFKALVSGEKDGI